MSVSGRAGLFTIDPRFTNDLRDDVHTAPKRQKSGALRLEFGQLTWGAASVTSAAVKTTVNTGIAVTVTPHRNPTFTVASGFANTSGTGAFIVGCTGAFQSGQFGIFTQANGGYQGETSGINISYMVIGY